MKESKDQLSSNTHIFPAPERQEELGQLVMDWAEQGCRALLIDFKQKMVVVHGSSYSQDPKFGSESLPFFLSSLEIEMLPDEHALEEAANSLEEHAPANHIRAGFFCNPLLRDRIASSCQIQVYPSDILESNTLLLCTQDEQESTWNLFGALISPT